MPKSDQGVQQNHKTHYVVVPRTLIFVTREEDVLLLKGAAHKRLWANKYNGIGGHIEQGEDVLSSARRELKEETGLDTLDLWLCGTVMIDVSEEMGISLFILRGEYDGGDLIASREGEPGWFKRSNVLDLTLVEDLKVLLPRVLSMQRGDAPFSARYFYDAADCLNVVFGH